MSSTFEVGDVIFYKSKKGVYHNGVISKQEQDGSYSIYLLNTSGKKIYRVPREQLLYQFESAAFVEEMPALTPNEIMEGFERALRGMMQETDAVQEKEFSAYQVGDGAVFTSYWKDGSAILKWDGKHAVDVNLYTANEDVTREMREVFQRVFAGSIEKMEKLAQDEHPRGFGAVVNFPSEIANPPRWIS